MRARLLRILLALFTGTFFLLNLAPFSFWPLSIVALAWYFHSVNTLPRKQAIEFSFWFGLSALGVGLHWFFVALHSYLYQPVWMAATFSGLCYLITAILFSVPIGVIHSRFFQNKSWAISALAFASLWMIFEWNRTWIFPGFSWLYIGSGFVETWLAGYFPIVGTLGVAFIVALLGAFASQIVASFASTKTFVDVLPQLALSACIWVLGAALSHVNWTTEGDVINVALVQPNVDQHNKIDTPQDAVNSLLELSEPLWASNDLVAWPESAIPLSFPNKGELFSNLEAQALETNTALVTGAPIQFGDHKGYQNTAQAIGLADGQYVKRKLIPFGEYLPWDEFFRPIIESLGFSPERTAPGKQQANMSMTLANSRTSIPFLVALCYENTYPDFIAKSAANSQFILGLSNHSFFGRTVQSYQHSQMLQARALENQQYALNVTNNGYTVIIDPRGKLVASLPRFTAGALTGSINARIGSTPFQLIGSLPFIVLAFLYLLLVGKPRKLLLEAADSAVA